MPYKKLPPHSKDAEMSVLGSCLIDTMAVEKSVLTIDSADFYSKRHQKIFTAIVSVYQQNNPVDLLTVSNELVSTGNIEVVGGDYYLAQLSDRTPSAANIEAYLGIVKNTSMLRRLAVEANNTHALAYQSNYSEVMDVIATHINSVDAIAKSMHQKDYSMPSETLPVVISETEELFHSGKPSGTLTGFNVIDKLTHGIQPGQLWILAARPSMGKTALAEKIALNIAGRGAHVAFNSLEMTESELHKRHLSMVSRVELGKILSGGMSTDEFQRVTQAAGDLYNLPLFIDEQGGLPPVELRAKLSRLKSEHDIKVLFVDYIQLMRYPGSESRTVEVTRISNDLKAIGKELGVGVVALSQLSRANEKSGSAGIVRPPRLSDLRESGAIEQDADVVIFIHRPEYYGQQSFDDGSPTDGLAQVIIGKQRNGPTDTIEMRFEGKYVSFEEMGERPPEPLRDYTEPQNKNDELF